MDRQKKTAINTCIMGIKRRDEKSVDVLYDLIGHTIRYIALKYVKNEEEANDLEQDFWANIYNIADGYTYFENGFGYLCKVMNNMATNRVSKYGDESKRTISFVDYRDIQVFDEATVIDKVNDRIVVEKALDKLKDLERIVIQLSVFEDKTLFQISKELKLPKSTVGRIRQKACEKLKKELSKRNQE